MTDRIVPTPGAAHPFARIDSVDAEAGVCSFSWLDAQLRPIDSGGSIARFEPVPPAEEEEPQEPAEEGAPEIEPEPIPSDEVLAVAIANPPADPLPVPASVTRRQLLLVLNAAGVTRAMIRAQIGDNEAALIEYEEATSFERAHPLVAQLAAAMGLGAEQVDELFRTAAQL